MAGTDPAVRSHWQVLHKFRAHATYAAWEHVLHIYAASVHVLHALDAWTDLCDRTDPPSHPLQEVWLTGKQIRSRLSTSPNLTQAVLSARVKAARKQQQKKQFLFLLLIVIDYQSHVTPTTYWTNTNNWTFCLGWHQGNTLHPIICNHSDKYNVVTEFAISSQSSQRGSHI